MKQAYRLAGVLAIGAMVGGYLAAPPLPTALAQSDGEVHGRYQLLETTVTIRRGKNAVPLEEHTVFRINTHSGATDRYVENVSAEGKISRRWFPIEDVRR